jgi:hypothetical protein
MQIDYLHNIQASMNRAAAASNQTGYVGWQDIPLGPSHSSLPAPGGGCADFTMNGTTAVTIVPAPVAGYFREVTHLGLYNVDSNTNKLILQRTVGNNANNNSVFYEASMLTLANWVYERGIGWRNQSAAGLSL